jgi:hypothetical protein
MLNTKEYFKQLDTTLALEELDDEVAANCGGGVAYLYEDEGFRGRRLKFSEGESDLRKWHFNDKTSSIQIVGNETWAFYRDINYQGPFVILLTGSYPILGNLKDSISSLRRVA